MKKIDQQDHVTSTDVITLCKAGAQLGGGGCLPWSSHVTLLNAVKEKEFSDIKARK